MTNDIKEIKLRLLLITDGIYPFVIGGMQKHSYYLAKLLPKYGIKVTLIHCVSSKDDIPDNVKVYKSLEMSAVLKDKLEVITLKFPDQKNSLPGHYLKESYEYSCNIYDHIKDRLDEFDFVYAKGFTAWKLIQEKKRVVNCPPIGVKFHGLNMFQKAVNFKAKLQHLMFIPAVKYNMLNADYNFSYGGKITDITENVGVDKNKILEFPTGIGEDWLVEKQINQPIRTFVFIGRYERLKGIEELNIAIKSISGKYNFKFLFVGPIPDNKKLNISEVEYLGVIMEADKLKSVLDKADVLVCPSYSEGMPNVIMEAMANSLSVIATDVGAINVMVDNENGWLINGPKIDIITKTLIKAINLSDDELLLKKSKSYQKVIENFLWDIIAEKLSIRLKEITKH